MEALLVFVRRQAVLAHFFQIVVDFEVGDPTCAVQVAAPPTLVVGTKGRRRSVVLNFSALTRCARHREDTG